jgi:hypothetical protein
MEHALTDSNRVAVLVNEWHGKWHSFRQPVRILLRTDVRAFTRDAKTGALLIYSARTLI